MAYRRHIYNPTQLPLFTPHSAWRPISAADWPDFRAFSTLIGVDTETHDPDLREKGPGFVKDNAYVCGVSLASDTGERLYLPLRHAEDNVADVDQAMAYLRYQLGGDQPKCGANLTYDLEALWSIGIELKGKLADIQVAEPLLNEDRQGGYSLEALSQSYLGVGKTENLLHEAAAAYGHEDAKRAMAQLPARFVGPYAEDDAYHPVVIFQHQELLLKEEGLEQIFELERQLQRTLFKMRLRGVKVNVDEAERLSKELIGVEATLVSQITYAAGRPINPNASEDIAAALIDLGLPEYEIPKTKPTKAYPAGQFSITNDWLKGLSTVGETPALLLEWRKTNKMRKDFIEPIYMDSYKGRVYSNWHQLRETDGGDKIRGTRSGRVSSSKMNMTQIPSRDPRWGKPIRSLFVADDGMQWVKADYSQQEPRHTLHYAYLMKLDGAAQARKRYIDDPTTDYHQLTADLVLERSGRNIGRPSAKGINLGSAYGMGKHKLARMLGVSENVADEILKAYHEGVPYVRRLGDACSRAAAERGYVWTILKRKRRFSYWEPITFGRSEATQAVATREEAVRLWGRDVRRAFTHKALNAVIQGSAADQIKKALVDLDNEGLIPQIQVYDEINGSYPGPAEARRVQEIMETAIKGTIPFIAEPDIGPSWGQVVPLGAQ